MKILRAAIVIAALLPCAAAIAADQPAVQSETLLDTKSSWDGTPYKAYPGGQPELSVLRITIPPHTALKWHRHPMPNAAYVVSGELTIERQDNGARTVISQGHVLPEMVGTVHRGISGDAPVVLVVFYAGAEGLPLSQ